MARKSLLLWIGPLGLGVALMLLVFLPSYLQRHDPLYPFRGVEILGPDAEVHYAARVREIADGFPSLGNTFYSAPKNLPSLQPPLPEATIASAASMLGIDPLTAFLASKAVFAVTLTILFFAFLFVVTGSALTAFVSTALLLFGGALLSAPWDFPMFLRPAAGDSFEFLRFSRAINPQWTVSWFLGVLISLALWIKRPRIGWLAAAAACTGVLIYSYVYAWTYVLASVGLLTVWFLSSASLGVFDWRRDRKRLQHLALFWVVVIVVGIPYALNLLEAMGHPWFPESAQRLGMLTSHTPIIGVWLVVFIVVSFLTKRLWPVTWPLLPCLALGGLIALNQHVLTGRYIVPHHYHWYFIQPLASVFTVALALSVFFPFVRSRLLRGIVSAVLVASAIGVGFVQQRQAYLGVRDYWGHLQDTAPVLDFLRDPASRGDVIYSYDLDVLNLAPVYTSADVYTSSNANNYLVPLARARDVYFFDLWLEGVTPLQASKEFFASRRYTLSSRLYAIYYRELLGDYAAIPDAVIREHVAAYREYMKLSFREKLTRYPLTMVVTTPSDPDTVQWRTFLSCSKPIFQSPGYGIRALILAGVSGSCL